MRKKKAYKKKSLTSWGILSLYPYYCKEKVSSRAVNELSTHIGRRHSGNTIGINSQRLFKNALLALRIKSEINKRKTKHMRRRFCWDLESKPFLLFLSVAYRDQQGRTSTFKSLLAKSFLNFFGTARTNMFDKSSSSVRLLWPT